MSYVLVTLCLMLCMAMLVRAGDDSVWKFDGSPWQLNAWFSAVEAWFEFKEITGDDRRIVVWKMFVTPDVLLWYLEQAAEISWEGIKNMMRIYYLNDGVQSRAFESLMTVRQTGSVESYNVYFTRLVQSVLSDRLTPTLLLNRYISGLNRTLAKGVLAKGAGDWKRAQIIALELAGTPAYTKADSMGMSSDKAEKPHKKKMAATCITALSARDFSFPAQLNIPGDTETVDLDAYLDTMSTYNLISPSVVYWAELQVEHSEQPFHTCYGAESRPVYLHDRVVLPLTMQYDGLDITTEPMEFYILRIPYVHVILGQHMAKLIDKAKQAEKLWTGGGEGEGKQQNVGEREDPQILLTPAPQTAIVSVPAATTAMESLLLGEDPHTPRTETILGEVTPTLMSPGKVKPTRPRGLQHTRPMEVVPGDPTAGILVGWPGLAKLRWLSAAIKLEERGPPRMRLRGQKGDWRLSKLVVECPDLGWFKPPTGKPPTYI